MPSFKSKPAKAKAVAQQKAGPKSKKVAVAKPVDEEDEDDSEEPEDDDDDLDEDLDEIDEDVSIDEDEDEDDDEAEDDDEDDDDDDDDDDEEEEEKEGQPPAKKQKANGKEAPAKDSRKDAKVKDKVKETSEKKQKDSKKKDTAEDAEGGEDKAPVENRASAIGPLTEAEIKMFSDNFRAMSATSIFVGKLPEDATEEDLKKLHPAIRVVRRPVTRKGLPRTFAFLNFPNRETAERALKEINSKGPVKVRGQEVLVSENGNGQCHPPGLVDRRKLKIYGCPKHVSKEEIQKKLGCIDVILNDRDKGQALEAVAVYRTSADAKRVLDAQQTVTLNEAICAIFYLNISHNVKQLERKKDRKQQIKKELKERKARAKARAAEGAQDGSDGEEDEGDAEEKDGSEEESVKTTPLKAKKRAQPPPANSQKQKKLKRLPEDSDGEEDDDEDDVEEDDAEEEEPAPKKAKSAKKVSMRTPLKGTPQERKSTRKGTPYKPSKIANSLRRKVAAGSV